MRTFTVYRKAVPDHHNKDQANPPDMPQFEGLIFSDGTVAIRWLTSKPSVSFWASFDDMMAVHGHPEYESEVVWHHTADLERIIEWGDEYCRDKEHIKFEGSVRLRRLCSKCWQALKSNQLNQHPKGGQAAYLIEHPELLER